MLATVISCNESDCRRILDAGNKACDLLSGAPQLTGLPGGSALDPSLSEVRWACRPHTFTRDRTDAYIDTDLNAKVPHWRFVANALGHCAVLAAVGTNTAF
eukprot:COSAG02_NODE_1702_length_11245_cov_6.015432_5_plen_101_part_00